MSQLDRFQYDSTIDCKNIHKPPKRYTQRVLNSRLWLLRCVIPVVCECSQLPSSVPLIILHRCIGIVTPPHTHTLYNTRSRSQHYLLCHLRCWLFDAQVMLLGILQEPHAARRCLYLHFGNVSSAYLEAYTS